MPEGDTVHKLATFLRPALSGCRLSAGSVVSKSRIDLGGRCVTNVYAHGKHLFIELDECELLRSHLGMTGSWHSYAPYEAWQKPRNRASILLDAGDRLYVCFHAAQVELLCKDGVRHRELAQSLGPDLLADSPALEEAVARARRLLDAETPLVDVLLNQHVMTGVGNIYKSEVLFITGYHPLHRLDALDDASLILLFETASSMLKDNLGGGPRVTRRVNDDASDLWVYGRASQPCLKCDDRVVTARLGRQRRSTYWCPSCQPEPCDAKLHDATAK